MLTSIHLAGTNSLWGQLVQHPNVSRAIRFDGEPKSKEKVCGVLIIWWVWMHLLY